MVKNAKRALKMITAMLSIWIPGMTKLMTHFSEEGAKGIQ